MKIYHAEMERIRQENSNTDLHVMFECTFRGLEELSWKILYNGKTKKMVIVEGNQDWEVTKQFDLFALAMNSIARKINKIHFESI